MGLVSASFVSDLDKMKSTTGYIFRFGDCPISWAARLQPMVAVSTTWSAYMPLTKAYKERVWLKV